MAPPTSGCSQTVSSWAPATIQMAGVQEMPGAHLSTESAGETESASEPAPSSLPSVPRMQRGPKKQVPAIKVCSNLIDRDVSRCRHLEECMFPRFLSLDCKQIDDFCMGWNVKNPERTYIEALHLREFLKTPETITAEKNGDSSIAIGKRGLNNSSLCSISKKIKVESDARVADSCRLSQAYLGGIEGRRTWLLQNSHNFQAKKGAATCDEALDDLISSEIHLVSLRRAMRLHDQPIPLFFYEDDDLKRLMNLVKPLPGFSPPRLDSSDRIAGGHQVSNEKTMSSSTPAALSDVASHGMDINGNKNDTYKPIVSNDNVIPQSPNESPLQTGEDVLTSNTQRAQRLKSNFKCSLHKGKEAALAANKLIETFRRNRRKFYGNEKEYTCAWCPASNVPFTKSRTSFNSQFGVIRDSIISDKDNSCLHYGASGDALIQCLECNLVGCAPNVLNRGGSGKTQHAMLHFLMSGHRFGVTCGPLGEIFCIACGEVIHHECFDQERERSFLEHYIPTLCWSESPIIRGIDPSSFLVTPDNGVVWRGMMAIYPAPVSSQLVEASRLAMKRISIFRGDRCNRSMSLGPTAVKLSMYQRRAEDQFLPIGMYNLGNTCYMTATLQCLVHCKLLRELFLRDLAHPYQSCRALRLGSNKTSCLACELDVIFLEVYGSAVGIDAIAALEEDLELSSDATPIDAKEEAHETRGHPIIPSSILAESWRNRGMKFLASRGQHDAQEYFNAFVNCLATHTLAYQTCAKDTRQAMNKSQIKPLHPGNDNLYTKSDTDFITNTFKGTLRSVLICQNCGCKRTQEESFSNVSLPLAKNFPTANVGGQSSLKRGSISVEICLDQFTRPEALSDPVFCSSCNSKTKTQKQHTFSKLPNVLCLHLKRFNSDASKKVTDFVSFPAYDLDMGKHLPYWCEQGLEPQGDSSTKDTSRVDSPKILYDLFATVNHRGTLHQGHYTAYVKCGNRWYSCNDALITALGDGDGEIEVLSSEETYMLFYQKRK